MRVYGALMWSLGKVFNTPEVLRVYVGSFWDQPLRNSDCEALLEAEERDLISDLRSLPRNSAVRRVNELIKRARMAKVHALLICHLQAQFGVFGKDKKKQEILKNITAHFKVVSEKYNIPKGDFPNPQRFVKSLEHFEIHKFPKMKKEIMAAMEEVLTTDMPKLMALVPTSKTQPVTEEKIAEEANPFKDNPDEDNVVTGWAIDGVLKNKYDNEFATLPTTNGKLSGGDAKGVLMASGLEKTMLRDLWTLSDVDQDGAWMQTSLQSRNS
jgi:hypothetical protein